MPMGADQEHPPFLRSIRVNPSSWMPVGTCIRAGNWLVITIEIITSEFKEKT